MYLTRTFARSESGEPNLTTRDIKDKREEGAESTDSADRTIDFPCFMFGQSEEELKRELSIAHTKPKIIYQIGGFTRKIALDNLENKDEKSTDNSDSDYDDEPLHVDESKCRKCAKPYSDCNQPFDCRYDCLEIVEENKEENETNIYTRNTNCHFGQIHICSGIYMCARCDGEFSVKGMNSITRCQYCLMRICKGGDRCRHWHAKMNKRCRYELCEKHKEFLDDMTHRCGLCFNIDTEFKDQSNLSCKGDLSQQSQYVKMKICTNCKDYFNNLKSTETIETAIKFRVHIK